MPKPRLDEKAKLYRDVIEKVFVTHYRRGATEVGFVREALQIAARELGVRLPKNLGDVVYSFRFRQPLPESILKTAKPGLIWIIRLAGHGRYRFVQTPPVAITPNPALAETKVPDATPGLIELYALGDEQALLAKLRYNRLVDVFTGVACYSLQNHLRTSVQDLGQIETDEVYIGLDRRGAHYVFPIQAKGGREALGVVQVEQDLALCQAKFPALIARPIGAQFIEPNLIALFEFEDTDDGIRIVAERHYRLVPSEQMTAEEIQAYRSRPE